MPEANDNLFNALRSRLESRRKELVARAHALRNDLQHRDQPVEKDFAEQATQRENEEVLDALNDEARVELVQINHALARMDAGSYGTCERCGEAIATGRLQAIPETEFCIRCAQQETDDGMGSMRRS